MFRAVSFDLLRALTVWPDHAAGQDPAWEGLHEWGGLRITSIPQALDLLG